MGGASQWETAKMVYDETIFGKITKGEGQCLGAALTKKKKKREKRVFFGYGFSLG